MFFFEANHINISASTGELTEGGATGLMMPHPFDMTNLVFILDRTCNSLLLDVAPNFNAKRGKKEKEVGRPRAKRERKFCYFIFFKHKHAQSFGGAHRVEFVYVCS